MRVRRPVISVEVLEDAAVIRFDGTIEIFHADQIRRTAVDLIEGQGLRSLVFSLCGVTSVASSAFGVFLTLMQSYRHTVQFRFCCLSEQVQSVFAAARLYDFFPVDPDVDSSLQVVRSQPAV